MSSLSRSTGEDPHNKTFLKSCMFCYLSNYSLLKIHVVELKLHLYASTKMFGEAMKKLTGCFEGFHSLFLHTWMIVEKLKQTPTIDLYKGQN